MAASESKTLADTPENRAALTEKYFELVPFDKMMQGMGEEVAKSMPPSMQESFKQHWTNFMSSENTAIIVDTAKKSFSKNMNTAELAAFIRFMEDPNGRSAMDKMKFYMADIMPMLQQLTMKAAAGFREQQAR